MQRYLPRKPHRTTTQRWKTFLKNRSAEIISLDFFVVPTITFKLLHVLVFLSDDRRRIIHFNVTDHPTSEWTTQQKWVSSFAIVGTNLFAGVAAHGVWRRPLSEMITDVGTRRFLPTSFALEQNYPNPFNPSTTIRYGLPRKSQVSLIVYNTLGQMVSRLVSGEQGAGYHEVRFDATGLSSGVYFYRLEANDFVSAKKLLLLR